jgi:hypothetical protein
MLNPIITPPRVPLVDPDTGLINRAWYLFFLSLNNVTNAVVDNPDVGPNADSLIASYDAALQALAQNVDTQPLPTDLSAELTKQIEAAGLVDQSQALLSQIAEMQKQIDALNLLPLPPQSNLTSGTSICTATALAVLATSQLVRALHLQGALCLPLRLVGWLEEPLTPLSTNLHQALLRFWQHLQRRC